MIADKVPDVPRARVFDPLEHGFNPLKDIDYKKAREIADVIYGRAARGEYAHREERETGALEGAPERGKVFRQDVG